MSCPSNTKRLRSAPACSLRATALSGCSDIYFDRRETIAPWSGNAVQQNKVVQMVDPWPPYSANRNIAFNGEVMRARSQRVIATRNVIPPINPTTSDSGGQPRLLRRERGQGVQIRRNGATTPPSGAAVRRRPGPGRNAAGAIAAAAVMRQKLSRDMRMSRTAASSSKTRVVVLTADAHFEQLVRQTFSVSPQIELNLLLGDGGGRGRPDRSRRHDRHRDRSRRHPRRRDAGARTPRPSAPAAGRRSWW